MGKLKKQLSKIVLISLILSNFNFLSSISFADDKKEDFIPTNWLLDSNKANNQNTDWIIIKFKNNKINLKTANNIQSVYDIAKEKWLILEDSIKDENISSFKIKDKNISIEKLVNSLKNEDSIEKVQVNYIYRTTEINSNDTYKNNLWWLDNFGQTIEWQNWNLWADMSWNKANNIFSWTTNTANTWVIVAVLDSWVAYNHTDLANQMWDWTNCKDENWDYLGWCIHWYDFADDDKDPNPTIETHWTHVAWTIAAEFNNSNWITWVNPKAKIMAIRMWDSSFTTLSVLRSIYFALENWAKIINASFWAKRTDWFDSFEYTAIKDFTDNWWLFIVAAWNDAQNNDDLSSRFFPASFWIDNYVDSNWYLTWNASWSWITKFNWITNLISVAATDNQDNLSTFSNYWANTVNIWAPWTSIYSTVLWEVNYFSWTNISNFTTWGINNNWWNITITWSLRSDLSFPYSTWADSYVEKSVDISSAYNPNIKFLIWCDAWKNLSSYDDYSTDYASISFSTWWAFTEIDKYNYTSSSLIYSANWWFYNEIWINLNNYKSSDFKFRFNWHTDWIQDSENGCFIYELAVNWTDNWLWNAYWFLDWTSMATPNVVWLASLAWSYKPNLSAINIKNAILNNWDSISSLSGFTTSWKRINAFKTLLSLTDTWSITQIKAYSDSWKTLELASWSFLKNPSIYLEWLDSTNYWAIEKYKIEIKDNSWNLLETNYSSWNTLSTNWINIWTWTLTSSYTWSNIKYVVIPVMYDWREWTSKEINFIYDNISPVFSSLNYTNNQEVTNSSIVLNWTIIDTNLSWALINWTWLSLNSSWTFSTNINLNPWLNSINLEANDKAWNITSTWINIIRIGNAPKLYSSITNTWNIKLEFNSDFTSTWIFLYWTWWNLDNIFTWSYSDSHILNIPYLTDDETYYFRAYYTKNWYNSPLSETWIIKTPNVFDLSVNTWSLSITWSMNLSNVNSTWTIIDWTWTIDLYSENGANLISIPRWIEIISWSWSWDKIIQAPHQVTSSWTISYSWYVRNNDLTFKIGSDSDSLNFSGWVVNVKLNIWSSYNWKNIKIYKSDDNQNSFNYLWNCIVSSWICNFNTDSFSYFALLEPISDTTPDNFSFTSVNSAELNTQYTSNTITVTWINSSTWVTSTAWTLVINWSDSWTSGTVSSGTTVAIKLTSSSSYSSSISSTINIWWISSIYTITTKSAPVSSGWGGGGGWSYISTCLDTQLVCTNWKYYRKTWISCTNWNLWKACSIESTWSTNTWITNNNLQNLLDEIKKNPDLNKTYNITDISNHFAKKYVDELINRWIIKWYSDNTFKPDNAITRAEYLSILMKALNIKVDSSITKSINFSDIENNSWQIKYAEKARLYWISSNSNKFRPNDYITRAEALAMLFKISKLNLQTNISNNFSDTDLEEWMLKYTTKAKSLWLVKWQEINWKSYFKPNNNITRAETSKIIVNLLKIMWK